jgi:pimeloyl-ACP methyl ester carboxylesterase
MQSKYCKTPNGKIHYLEGGKGDAIVLITGIWTTSASLNDIGELLSQQFHVYIPDLYKGKSAYKVSPTKINDYTAALHAFITAANIKKCSLIAWSSGGLIIASYSKGHVKKIHKLIFLSSSTMHLTMMENLFLVSKGYFLMLSKNFFSLRGLQILQIWLFDASTYFLRHPRDFLRELVIFLSDRTIKKPTKMLVESKLFAASDDEYVSPELLKSTHKDIKKLEIEIIDGGHDWFFHDKQLFLRKVVTFLKK